jgi:ankyrin repeat protein
MIALLENRYDLNLKDTSGRTPLSWIAESGYEAVIKLLLANDGVNPDSKDNGGRTPL